MIRSAKWTALWKLAATVCLLLLGSFAYAETPKTDSKPAKAEPAISVAEARNQAKLMHEIYKETLQTVHRYYFHDGEIAVSSRVLEDVFYRLARRTNIKARWISVNAETMSIEHEPEDEFAKNAAKALRGGEEAYELVKDGQLHRATPIPLFTECIHCHRSQSRKPVAGLIISMPVAKK